MRPWRLPALLVLCAVWLAFADVALAHHASVPNVEVVETASAAEVWVYWSCGGPAPGTESGSPSWTYRTEDGSAKAGEDYEAVTGTLPGSEGRRNSFQIPLIDDKIREPDETVRVIVTVPPDEFIFFGRNCSTEWETIEATLTIFDDETPRPASSPGVISSGSVGPGGVASGSVGAGASASEQGSGGPSTLLAEGLSASGVPVTADTTDTGEAQGLASRSAAQHESSPWNPAPFIALGAVLVIMGTAFSPYLRRRIRSQF